MDSAKVSGSEITTIALAGVNAYLVRAGESFVLVDTGKPEKRTDMVAQLERAGCRRGDLRLIVLTHGDYDHAGNAAHLREEHGAGIAMHPDDAGRVESADWSLGMKAKPDKFPLLFRAVSVFVRPGAFDVFTPDVLVEDGWSLGDTAWTPSSSTFQATRIVRSASSPPPASCSAATSWTACWVGRASSSSSTTWRPPRPASRGCVVST